MKPKLTPSLSSKDQALRWNQELASTEYTQRRMTFGRYVNVQIKDIPTDYIKWGILNFKDLKWASYFSRELQRREPHWKWD